MTRFVVLLSALWLAVPAVAWGQLLCQFVDGGRAREIAGVEHNPGFDEFKDAFEGPAESTNWLTSDLVDKYDVTSDGDDSLTPAEIGKRLSALAVTIDRSAAFGSPDDNGRLLRAHLVAELTRLARAVLEKQDQTMVSWADLKAAGGGLARFDQANVPRDICQNGVQYATNSAFFSADSLADETIALRLEKMVAGPLGTLSRADGEDFYIATLDQAIEFRAVILEVNKLFQAQRLATVNEAALRLTEINQGWSNLLEKGYSQYPWESLINSAAWRFTWDKPPRWQWVVVHPEVAIAIDARSSSSATLEGALLVHGAGIIRYWGEDLGWFLGASGTLSITSGDDVGVGGGGTVHFGHTRIHSKVPHISISVLYQDSEFGSGGPFIGISADLWRLFQSDSAQGLFKRAAGG
jgi:hypothetical protein